MRLLLRSLLLSIVTAVYWWLVFTIVYADVLFAGDRSPMALPRTDHDVVTRNVLVLVSAILIYGGLGIAWAKVASRLRRDKVNA